jgi:hypothetical protein
MPGCGFDAIAEAIPADLTDCAVPGVNSYDR